MIVCRSDGVIKIQIPVGEFLQIERDFFNFSVQVVLHRDDLGDIGHDLDMTDLLP